MSLKCDVGSVDSQKVGPAERRTKGNVARLIFRITKFRPVSWLHGKCTTASIGTDGAIKINSPNVNVHELRASVKPGERDVPWRP